MGPWGFWTTFLVAASMGSAIFGRTLKVLGHASNENAIVFGIALGIVFGAVTAFFMKRMVITVAYNDREEFLAKLNEAAAQMTSWRWPGTKRVLKPDADGSIWVGIATGEAYTKVKVQLSPGSATITGPGFYAKRLARKLA